jgi:hypothetical protein
MCPGTISSSWSTSGIHRATLVSNPVNEWMRLGPDYDYDKRAQIFRNGLQSHGGDWKIFKVMISTSLLGPLGSVSSLLTASFYQGKHYISHMIHNINLPTPVKTNVVSVYHHHWREMNSTQTLYHHVYQWLERNRLIIFYWYSCF